MALISTESWKYFTSSILYYSYGIMLDEAGFAKHKKKWNLGKRNQREYLVKANNCEIVLMRVGWDFHIYRNLKSREGMMENFLWFLS